MQETLYEMVEEKMKKIIYLIISVISFAGVLYCFDNNLVVFTLCFLSMGFFGTLAVG